MDRGAVAERSRHQLSLRPERPLKRPNVRCMRRSRWRRLERQSNAPVDSNSIYWLLVFASHNQPRLPRRPRRNTEHSSFYSSKLDLVKILYVRSTRKALGPPNGSKCARGLAPCYGSGPLRVNGLTRLSSHAPYSNLKALVMPCHQAVD